MNNYMIGKNNTVPNCHRKRDKKTRPFTKRNGMIINKQTGEKIGIFTHNGAPDVGELACHIPRSGLVSYKPLAEKPAG